MIYKYTFKNGDVVTSQLNKEELIKRTRRLDILRVLTEGYEEGEGLNICKKALKAYNKVKDFTGIIRLTSTEKDFLNYILEENEYITEEDKDVLKFYIGG